MSLVIAIIIVGTAFLALYWVFYGQRRYNEMFMPKRKTKLKAVLFDLDGVILDSFEAWLNVFNHARKHFKLKEISKEEFRKNVWGGSVQADVKNYFKSKEVKEIEKLYKKLISKYTHKTKLMPDAIKVLESTPFEKLRRADVIIILAQAYLDERRYGDAIDLLESTPYFVNWEGQTVTWDIFNQAHLERGRKRFENKDLKGALEDFEAALTYPDNIGVGRSNKPREARAQYWRGKTLQALGRLEDARSAWKEGTAGHEGSGEQNKHRKLCMEELSKIE